jgi:hypothetical protein
MTNTNKSEHVYIAREILVSDGGLIRIDEEGIFSTFDAAYAFIEHLRKEGQYVNESSASIEAFRHEIIQSRLNDYENWNSEVTWTYKLNGELLSRCDAGIEPPNPFESVSFRSLFELGEIVRAKPSFEEPESHLATENYGVICQIPVSQESWKTSGEPLEDWDGAYIVLLISEMTNLLYHEHLIEICLDKFEGTLPEDLIFLNLLSKYIENDGNVPNAEHIKRALFENAVVRKIDYYFEDKS